MTDNTKRLSTGVPGLDEVIGGGFISGRSYLVRGGPGTGKTTLGFHFLCESIAEEEKSLFISLTEPAEKLRHDALQRKFDVNKVEILDLTPSAEFFYEGEYYNVVSSGEIEQEPMVQKIIQRLNELQPKRVFLDCASQFHYLAPDNFQFRKSFLLLMDKVIGNGATFLFSSETSSLLPDDDLQFLCDGIITLELVQEKRQIQVSKFRGSDFIQGVHALRLDENGMVVFPVLKPKYSQQEYSFEIISSGVPEVDELLHGGIERGTATVISGPTGVGKTTLGVQFMKEAAGRGERSVIYTFEEGVEALQEHCEAVNIPVASMLKKGSLSLVKIDPLEYMPNEFSHHIRREVEEKGTKIVMLDSISGYRLSFGNEYYEGYDILRHLHSLSEYLKSVGVTVILINEVQNITGDFKVSDYGISYLADNIIFMRYLEMRGEMNKAIGVLKKRLSGFEKALREVEITKYGFKVGKPLTGLRGVLSGSPEFISTPIDENK
ncbi:MAG: ATPase domain-containing protein [Bacillota bacterium]